MDVGEVVVDEGLLNAIPVDVVVPLSSLDSMEAMVVAEFGMVECS